MHGHETKVATCADTARKIAKKFSPELLITDWMLAEQEDGLVLVKTLKEFLPELSVIIITGYPTPELKEDAQKVGILTFFEKPFRIEDLLAAVTNEMV